MPNTLRVTFKKGSAMRYMGHLDILRTFIRGLRRADVPVKYSEGFNPHAVMAFALPLGVGTTSDCELADIVLKEEMPVADFIKAVNENMPVDGIEVVSAEYTDEKMPNIVKAEYDIEIENDKPIDISEVEKVLSSGEIMVEKKSKRQMKEVNLSEHIFEYKITQKDDRTFVLNAVISAGNTFNVKPQLLVSGIVGLCDSLNPIAVMPNRKRFLFEL